MGVGKVSSIGNGGSVSLSCGVPEFAPALVVHEQTRSLPGPPSEAGAKLAKLNEVKAEIKETGTVGPQRLEEALEEVHRLERELRSLGCKPARDVSTVHGRIDRETDPVVLEALIHQKELMEVTNVLLDDVAIGRVSSDTILPLITSMDIPARLKLERMATAMVPPDFIGVRPSPAAQPRN